MFSKNVSREIRLKLSRMSGFQETGKAPRKEKLIFNMLWIEFRVNYQLGK
jgi:hypothetical protein